MSLIMHQSIRATGASYYTRGIPGHGRQGPVQLEDGTYEQMYPQVSQPFPSLFFRSNFIFQETSINEIADCLFSFK